LIGDFRYAGTPSEYLGRIPILRSSGQGRRHRSKKGVCAFCSRVVYVWL